MGSFGVAERPDFVALHGLAGQVAEGIVLVVGARLPQVGEKFDDGVLRHPCDPHRGSDRHAFNEVPNDLRSLLVANGQAQPPPDPN